MSGNGFQQGPEELQQILENFKNKFQKFSGGKNVWSIVVIVLAFFILMTSFYTVQPQEEAVILRFGKYVKTTMPGLHFKLPFGIESATKIKTKLIHQVEFGFRSSTTGSSRSQYSSKYFKDESLMLTGDLNVADVEWIVQYQISDPQKYLFHVRDVKKNMSDVSQSVMRRVVGDRRVDSALTTGRVAISEEAHKLMQDILNNYDMGIRIVTVKLQDVNPPEPVKPSFNEVNAAKQEQEKMINQAEEHYNKIIPEAKGKADQQIQDAEGYASALINRAKGDAENFDAKLRSYQRAPAITRTRLYLEAVEALYGKMKEMVIVDSSVKGLLPIFDGKAFQPKEEVKND